MGLFPNVNLTIGRLIPEYRLQNASAQVDFTSDSQSESWFLFFLHGFMFLCWPAIEKFLVDKFQTMVVQEVCHWVFARLQRLGGQWLTRPTANDAPPDLVTGEQTSPARTTSPRKTSWTYLRGVSLALSELCQDGNFGGDRIPLSAILDLMRQHQSAFVPLGPHVERDVPKRLVQLANEGVLFFDPFKKYVIVPEATRRKYALRRRELLAKGVDPANLSVFGAAFTRGLFTSERVTNAAVARYKGQFVCTQGQMGNRTGAAITRQESLASIADAICPARLMPEIEVSEGNNTRDDAIVRRGHSIVTEVARIIGGRPTDSNQEGITTAHRSELRRGPSILPEMSAVVHERDALEAQNNRLRTILETSD